MHSGRDVCDLRRALGIEAELASVDGRPFGRAAVPINTVLYRLLDHIRMEDNRICVDRKTTLVYSSRSYVTRRLPVDSISQFEVSNNHCY